MNRQKTKKIILPKLHDYSGDISRQWFIYFSFRDSATDKMKRFKIYEGFTERKTSTEKYAHAKSLIKHYSDKLLNGWDPFNDKSKVVYSDELIYQKDLKSGSRRRIGERGFTLYCSTFLKNYEGIRPSTYTTYKSKLRYFMKFVEDKGYDKVDMAFFDSYKAREFCEYLKNEKGLTNKTINEYVILMKAFFRFLITEKALSENPFSEHKRLPIEVTKPRIYDRKLMKRITSFASGSNPQLAVAVRIIFNCFIRPGELRKLQIRNIDFKRGQISVPATVAKTKKHRVVDIPDYLLQDLIELNYDKASEDSYIITSKGYPGPRMASRNFLYNEFVALKKELGISKDYILYAFKHTGMVELKRSGADWLEVRNQAGHKSLDQTIEYTQELMGMQSKHIKKKAPVI